MFSIFWPFKLIGGIARFLLNLLVFASCVLTLTAFMGERGWAWSLTTHFRMQYLVIQLLALLMVTLSWWLLRKKGKTPVSKAEMWITTVFLMFFAGLNISQIAPYYSPLSRPDASHAKTERMKLMHVNLFGHLNHSKSLVTEAIRKTDPDIVDFVEYTPPWQRQLEQSDVLKRYPYRVSGRGHIGLYSKRPLMNARLVYADPSQKLSNQANIVAQIRLGGEPVTILVAHPASPIMPSHLDWQQASFRAWERNRGKLGKNLVLVGDLNTAPWSREFESLVKNTGLRDSQLGYGLQPTWPVFFPVPGTAHTQSPWATPLSIPIDHVLVSERILVLSRQTGPFVGSDHLPVVVELGLKK